MNNHNRIGQSSRYVYTHQLPYAVRKDICDILDADKSWRTLGGNFIGLDSTQLALIGQAILRSASPTEELLNKLDSANFSISDFCYYLKQMNHYRALEILKPYGGTSGDRDEIVNSQKDSIFSVTNMDHTSSKSQTLNTPTPSFADQPAAIMGLESFKLYSELESHQWQTRGDQNQTILRDNSIIRGDKLENSPNDCHKSRGLSQATTKKLENQTNNSHLEDPGEEIVRMACVNNRKRTSISDQEAVNQLRLIMQINYKELKQASNDFSDSNIVGNGGFATVYSGNWKGTDVAIKRLKCNLMDQALNELTILNSYRIDNILPIYGISIDGPEACLVYQFMSNGSLEDRLSCKKDTPPLTWNQRASIGEGVAKGLYYLHTLRDKPLVHGDVKSANVLLDAQFVPKLGDFGLARQVFIGKNPKNELCTHCTVSSIHGTSVYLPPEYLRHKILSPAVDVYSYGIVLLEMATGKRAYDGKRLLVDLVEGETHSMPAGKISYSLKDPRLADDTQNDLKIWYELLLKLGLNCSHKMKKRRLDMEQVLRRFSDFRSTSPECDSSGSHNLITLSSYGSATAKNFPAETPGYVRQEYNRGDAKVVIPNRVPGSGQNNRLNIIDEQAPLPRVSDLLQEYNSAMSVEEESGSKYICLGQTIEQQHGDNLGSQQVATPDHQMVEAMIPLLTELGVVTEHK